MTPTRIAIANDEVSGKMELTDEAALEATAERMLRSRLWVLTNAPSPYQVELLNDVSERDDVQLSIRYMRCASPSGMAVEASSGPQSKVLWGILPEWVRDEFRLHPQAIWEVFHGNHDVYVLSGLYTSPTFLMCAVASVIAGRKYVLWLERPHAASVTTFKMGWGRRLLQSIKHKYLRWLLHHAASVWCIGTRAEHDYKALGTIDGTIRVLPYCCRVDRFRVNESSVNSLRSDHEFDGKFVFLCSGQLIHRKGIDTLLTAFAITAGRNHDAVLLLLGDGPSKAEYVELAQKLGLGAQVRFLGHRPQSELPDWFGLADTFVFPSRHDGWAVAINEACAAGLPIIASEQTGAAHDLVQEGTNGFVLDCEDIDGWAERMMWCLEHRDELPAMGEASRRIVEPFSSAAGAARMAEYVNELAQTSSPISEGVDSA